MNEELTGEEIFERLLEIIEVRQKEKKKDFRNIVFFKRQLEVFENCEYCGTQFTHKYINKIYYCLCEECKEKYKQILSWRKTKLMKNAKN